MKVWRPVAISIWICVMRPDHPTVNKRATLDRYSRVKHLLVSPKGEQRNWVDEVLAEHGRTRHVAYSMPTYGPAPLILEKTDLVLTCPGSVGREFHERTGMLVSKCPVNTPHSVKSIHMVWHSRLGNHPAHIWLRSLLREIAGSDIV